MKNILIIAPHPDDEVLGCGGTISRFVKEGNHVFVLVASRGTSRLYSDDRINNVRKEAIEAHRVMGITNTFFLDFPAPELDTIPLSDISGAFSKIITENKIEAVFLPHRGDIHNDHRVVFNAGLVATRPVGDTTVKEIYAYETLSETEWAAPFGDDAFIPNLFVNVVGTFSQKIEAIQCFKSQLRDFPNPRSIEAITSLARYRGATIGAPLAEAFMVIRIIQ